MGLVQTVPFATGEDLADAACDQPIAQNLFPLLV